MNVLKLWSSVMKKNSTKSNSWKIRLKFFRKMQSNPKSNTNISNLSTLLWPKNLVCPKDSSKVCNLNLMLLLKMKDPRWRPLLGLMKSVLDNTFKTNSKVKKKMWTAWEDSWPKRRKASVISWLNMQHWRRDSIWWWRATPRYDNLKNKWNV